ncbi:MAG: TVP38/TMEM64 family protein [Firmicutes bacterium]|nr:TVP38/TMEM64 family protein [Bacillota bacterium]
MQDHNKDILKPIDDTAKDDNIVLPPSAANIDQGQPDNEQERQIKAVKKRKRKKARIIVLVVLALAIIAYFAIPAVNSKINQIFTIFSSASVETIMGYIRSFGGWAVLVSFLLMMFQSLIAPLPAFLLTFANAAVFGWWQGAILSWTSSMAGAALCFFIARVLGRDVVEKITGKGAVKTIDVFFERYGKNAILICRLLPFVSFDFVSYAAGLTGMGFWGFFLATGIGQLPATIVYSYVGGMLTGGTKTFVYALMIIFSLAALAFLIKKVYTDRHKKTPEPAMAEAIPAEDTPQE